MDKTFEYRSASWEASEGEKIAGRAVVFEQRTVLYKDPKTGYEYGEIIDRHALDGADLSDVILRYDHEGRVLARTRNGSLKLSIDNRGLYIEADLSGSDEAKSFYQDVRSGLIDKMSFAFQIAEDSFDEKTRTRRVNKIRKLFDVSIVSRPAYEQTEVHARNCFEAFAEPERRAFLETEVRTIRDRVCKAADRPVTWDRSLAEWEEIWEARSPRDENERRLCELRREGCTLIEAWETHLADTTDVDGALAVEKRMNKIIEEIYALNKQEYELREAITREFAPQIMTRKDSEMEIKNMRSMVDSMLEKRAAGTMASMSNVIPSAVMTDYVIENAPGAFIEGASTTYIAHNGDLRLPIATLQTVNKHTENEALPDAGYVPGYLLISHNEYAYNTGYSQIGARLSVESMQNIVEETLMRSMMKKMDSVCIDAVSSLTYEDGRNAVKVSESPSYDDLVALAGMLGADFVDGARWYVSSATYFNWLLSLKIPNGDLVLDPSKPVSEQAPLGFHISIDPQLPANVVYFGNGKRIHVNYAAEPELNLWTDYDHNTEKAGVRCVAGAAAEVGSFVKLYK